MTLAIVPFDPAHTWGARAHPKQAHYQCLLDDPWCYSDWWPETYSARDGGVLIAIGGVTFVRRVTAGWVLFTTAITPARFVTIHRTAVRFLAEFEQIDDPLFAQLDADYPEALRWAKMLGLERRRTDLLPDGRRMIGVEAYVH